MGVLPGQTADAVFTPYDKDSLIKGKAGSSTAKQSLCGCVDYKNLVPRTLCEGVALLHLLPGTAVASPQESATVQFHHPTRNKPFPRTSLAAGGAVGAGTLSRTHTADVPLDAFRCSTDPAAVQIGTAKLASFELAKPPGTPDTATGWESEAWCADECHRNVVVPGCATDKIKCGFCVGYTTTTGASTGSGCHLHYDPATAGAAGTASAIAKPVERHCKKEARTTDGGEFVRSRFTVAQNGTSDQLKVETRALPGISQDTTVAVLLRACHVSDPAGNAASGSTTGGEDADAGLVCAGGLAAKCTAANVQEALHLDIQRQAKHALLAGTADDAVFGCVKNSVVGTGSKYHDCVPPDLQILNDLEKGYYFASDKTGKPKALAATQALGKVRFGWTDLSNCETQFVIERSRQCDACTGLGGLGCSCTAHDNIDQAYQVSNHASCHGYVGRPEPLPHVF